MRIQGRCSDGEGDSQSTRVIVLRFAFMVTSLEAFWEERLIACPVRAAVSRDSASESP